MTNGSREYPARPIVGVGVALLRPAPGGPEVLLIRRGRPPSAGMWSLPGGAQRLGETVEAAARRELAEETGLTAGALHLAGHVDSLHPDADGRPRYHYTIIDLCGVWQGDAARAGGDADAVRWAGPAEFAALGLWTEAIRIYEAARKVLDL